MPEIVGFTVKKACFVDEYGEFIYEYECVAGDFFETNYTNFHEFLFGFKSTNFIN